jgi:hypothetical protein
MPPDLPLFIRPTGEQSKDYRGEWFQFMKKGKDSRFFVNPYPKFTSDIILNSEKVKNLVNNTIKTNEDLYDISPKAIYSPGEQKFGMDQNMADSFLTPLLYSYNSL